MAAAIRVRGGRHGAAQRVDEVIDERGGMGGSREDGRDNGRPECEPD